MIHYHGGPITPDSAAMQVWRGRHAFISFAYPAQVRLAAGCCQSFALDNGAFTFWKQGSKISWRSYFKWCEEWLLHPACDWAIIPDVIDGGSKANEKLIKMWPFGTKGVPVWHLNEEKERLQDLCWRFPRVALGSSAEYDVSNTMKCLRRLYDILPAICKDGQPIVKLHGLRMLKREVCTKLPLASADSTYIGRTIGLDVCWRNGVAPVTKSIRGLVLVDRIESSFSLSRLPKKLNTSNKMGFGL